MDSYSPVCHKRAIEELERGQEFANKLQRLFLSCQDSSDGDSVTADVLVRKVLSSFINTISLFSSDHNQIHNISNIQDSSSSSYIHINGTPKSEPFEEITNLSPPKDPRRFCNMKRIKVSQSRCVDSPNWMMQDSHSWRKYGQKEIQNTKFPRNYYRCTHKFDQGCKAIKHVQRIRERPQLYRTTYFGHHTCKNLQQYYPQIFLQDSTSECDNARLLCFGTAKSVDTQADTSLFFSSFFSPSNVKQESIEEAPSNIQPENCQSSCSSDILPSQVLQAFDNGDDSSPSSTFCMSMMEASDEFSFWDSDPPRLEDLLQE